MNITAVIFDLFGTLVDDFVTSFAQVNAELTDALQAPFEPFTGLWGQTTDMRIAGAFQSVESSLEHVCNALSLRVTREQMSKAVEIRLQYTRRALEPRPDAIKTLLQLKQAGYKIGLLSNCSIEIPIVWPETALANFVDAAIFSARERLKKPDPRIYHFACERLGVAPERCLYIADGENFELTAAAKVGLEPVLIRPALPDRLGDLRREAREWRGPAISTLAEVLSLLNLNK